MKINFNGLEFHVDMLKSLLGTMQEELVTWNRFIAKHCKAISDIWNEEESAGKVKELEMYGKTIPPVPSVRAIISALRTCADNIEHCDMELARDLRDCATRAEKPWWMQ